jgi:hypothetical protein
MRSSNSGCLTGLVAGTSRIFLIMFWIARPLQWNATFSSFIWPCLGFLFLPFTTLMFFLLSTGGGPIAGMDWLWLLLAVVLDIGSMGAAAAANRDRIPAGVPGSTAPPPTAPPAPPAGA